MARGAKSMQRQRRMVTMAAAVCFLQQTNKTKLEISKIGRDNGDGLAFVVVSVRFSLGFLDGGSLGKLFVVILIFQ